MSTDEHNRALRSLPVADSRPLVADLTGIPIALLEAHMEVLREMEADADANANNHSGDNFKRFVRQATPSSDSGDDHED